MRRRVFLTALSSSLKESPVIPLVESELLADILEEVRKAIGITFPPRQNADVCPEQIKTWEFFGCPVVRTCTVTLGPGFNWSEN